MAVLTKITSRSLADNAVSSAKIQDGAIAVADVADGSISTAKLAAGSVTDVKLSAGTTEADSFNMPGQHVKVPSVTTTQRNALTAAVGMMIYNSTLGIMQQYNATGWQSIDTPPSVTSLDYPASSTALNTAGGDTLIVNGSNFKAGLTVTINGTVPGSITVNSSTQLTLGNTPAKAAQTYVNGLVITNTTGLAAQVNVDYSALPAWTTSSGNVGSFFVTGSAIAEIDLAATSATNYAVTSGALPGGLSIGSGDGDINGTMSGTAATYNFTVTATDAETQTAARAFNIINKGPLPTGGTITTYGAYRVHTFTSLGNTNFVSGGAVAIDYIIIAGGGAGGCWHAGGGGAGGVRLGTGLVLTAQTYTITVGDGGTGGSNAVHASGQGGNSAMSGTGGFTTITASGGGRGGAYNTTVAAAGGSGAGGQGSTTTTMYTGGAGINDGGTFGTATYQGHNGGNGPYNHAGGGGGGAGAAGETSPSGTDAGNGGNGINAFWGMSAADTTLLLNSASIGEVVSGVRWVAGGGGGGVWANASPGMGGYGTKTTPRAQGSYNANSTAPIAVSDSMGAGGSGSGAQGNNRDWSVQTTGGSGVVIIRYLA